MFILLALGVLGLECDVVLETGICIYDGMNVVKPNSKPTGLQGYWTFDDNQCLDYSGNGNHGMSAPSAGHSAWGQGSSARFSGEEYVEIPSTASISTEIFSMTFWMLLEKEDTINQIGLRWCPIIQKGVDDEDSDTFHRTPGVFYDREKRMIRVYVTTTEAGDFPEGEFVESYAHVPFHRWTHVAIVRSTLSIKLYVNGILDRTNTTQGWTETNDDNLFLGNTPSKIDQCPVPWLLDELRYYDREITDEEIMSDAAGAFGQIEPRFIALGCTECTLDVAFTSCDTGYHLCTTIELHSGGYSVVRAMGWHVISPTVWSYSALEDTYGDDVLGLGVCCLDLGY